MVRKSKKMRDIRDALEENTTTSHAEQVKQAWIDAARQWRIENFGEPKPPKSDDE